MQSADEQSVLSHLHDKSTFPFLTHILIRQLFKMIVCAQDLVQHFRVYPDFWNHKYRGVDKSLDRPTSRYTLFDGEIIFFGTSLVIYTR